MSSPALWQHMQLWLEQREVVPIDTPDGQCTLLLQILLQIYFSWGHYIELLKAKLAYLGTAASQVFVWLACLDRCWTDDMLVG
jgi:hypothetical protein